MNVIREYLVQESFATNHECQEVVTLRGEFKVKGNLGRDRERNYLTGGSSVGEFREVAESCCAPPSEAS